MLIYRKTGFAVAAAIAAALTVAGCTPASPVARGRGAGTAAPPSAAARAVTEYQAYTGGPGGVADATAAPVTIGYLGVRSGPSATGALASTGAQMAVTFINRQLGGIDGHPLKLDTCFTTTAAPTFATQGADCARKFLAAPSLPLVATGVAAGAQSFFATLAGKIPAIDGEAITPYDAVAKNTTILFGDSTHTLGPIGGYATRVLQAKTVSLIYPQDPGTAPGVATIEAGLTAAGVQVTTTPYPAGDTNLAPVLTAAHAATADMVVPYADAAHCASLAAALRAQGITDARKIVSGPQCLTGAAADGPGDFPQWTYAISSSLYGDPTDAGIPSYQAVARQYTSRVSASDPWEIINFGQILTAAKLLNQVGYDHLSAATVGAAAAAFTGPQALGPPQLDCGQFSSEPAVCNSEAQFFAYDGQGEFTKIAGWTKPPPGFRPR